MREELQAVLKSSGYFSFLQQVDLTDEQCGLLLPPISPRMHLGKIMQSSQVSCKPGVICDDRCVGLGRSRKLSYVLFHILHFQGAGTVHLWAFLSCTSPARHFLLIPVWLKRNSALRSLGLWKPDQLFPNSGSTKFSAFFTLGPELCQPKGPRFVCSWELLWCLFWSYSALG